MIIFSKTLAEWQLLDFIERASWDNVVFDSERQTVDGDVENDCRYILYVHTYLP